MKTTIGTKLMAASAAMFALTALLGYTGLNSLSTFNARFDTVADKTTRKIELATAMDDAQSEMMSAQNGIVLGAFAKDPAEISTNEQSFRKYAERIRKITEELSPMLITAESKGLTKDAEARLGEWLPLFEDLLRAANGENASEADRIRRQLTAPVMEKLGADVTRLQQIEREVLARDKAALAEEYSHSWTVSAVLMALCFAMGLASMYQIRSTVKVLRRAMTLLLHGAEEVTNASVQVSSASQSVAQGASEQAASLEETSASGREIHSSAVKNTARSEDAAELVTQSRQKFSQANQSLDEMVAAMAEINSASNRISQIIRVIDELAFQTNILSLNAAVEAARAGEAGMGFAVVADAVRNLAQRSATAARDTASLIEGSITASHAGASKVNEVAVAIRGIAAETDRVKTLVEDVRADSKEQAKSLDSVSKALMEMEHVTQRSAASAEESAASAQELNSQAAGLRRIAEDLTIMLGRDEVEAAGVRGRRA